MSTTIAGYALLGWHASGREISAIRAELSRAEVRKGTISKVTTVLLALKNGVIKPEDVHSLSQSYILVVKGTPVDQAARLINKMSVEDRSELLKRVSGNL